MSTNRKQETDRQTDLVPEVAPPEVGHLKNNPLLCTPRMPIQKSPTFFKWFRILILFISWIEFFTKCFHLVLENSVTSTTPNFERNPDISFRRDGKQNLSWATIIWCATVFFGRHDIWWYKSNFSLRIRIGMSNIFRSHNINEAGQFLTPRMEFRKSLWTFESNSRSAFRISIHVEEL